MDAIITWLNTPVFTAFGAPTSWAELLGFITGAICVYLVAKQHILNWPIGIMNNVLWILLFATAGLYADSALQVVFIALALWGRYTWLYGGEERSELPVSRTTSSQWRLLLLAGSLGLLTMYYFLEYLTPSTVPFWDGLTTTLSLMAIWGQCMKKVESWYLWILADIIYIPLYHHKGLTLTAILYVGFMLLCVKGLLEWRRSLRMAQAPLTPPTPLQAEAVA